LLPPAFCCCSVHDQSDWVAAPERRRFSAGVRLTPRRKPFQCYRAGRKVTVIRLTIHTFVHDPCHQSSSGLDRHGPRRRSDRVGSSTRFAVIEPRLLGSSDELGSRNRRDYHRAGGRQRRPRRGQWQVREKSVLGPRGVKWVSPAPLAWCGGRQGSAASTCKKERHASEGALGREEISGSIEKLRHKKVTASMNIS